MPKGQGGGEYLFTFIVALIVMLAVGYALWNMGIIDHCSFQRTGSLDPESFLIKDYRFSGSDSSSPNEFEIVFLSKSRKPMNVTGMRIMSGDILCNQTGAASFSNQLASYGEKFSVDGIFTKCKRRVGDCLMVTLEIRFKTKNGLERTETGSIVTRVE